MAWGAAMMRKILWSRWRETLVMMMMMTMVATERMIMGHWASMLSIAERAGLRA